MTEKILPILLIGLGLVVLPFGTSWYEIPKVVLAWLAIGGLLSANFWSRQRVKIPWPPLVRAILVSIWLLSALSLVLFPSATAFFGNPFRLQGVLTFWALLGVTLLDSKVPRRFLNRLSILALVGTLIMAIFGQTDLSGRAVGTVGEPNSLGGYALFLWPLSLTGWVPTARKKIWSFFLLVVTVLIVFLSGSRSALIGGLVQGIIFGLEPKLGLRRATLFGLLFLLLSLTLPFFQLPQAFDFRPAVWRTAWQAGLERPILGWGFGNVEIGLRSAARNIGTSLRYQYVDSSHNLFLDWWVQGGLVGLTFFSSILFLAIRGLIRHKEKIFLLSLLGILTVGLFNPLSISLLLPLWWLIGRGLSSTRLLH